ncbi:hypothetical protein WHR41_06522 [Cladosporium halotolerans]|uniref:General transcription and DNA repair factor IIH subunit TFB5 n=1 Tax=Cladosporium halotolerans TaxID=1052096 RepID=A0AB34KJA3_9PEZI
MPRASAGVLVECDASIKAIIVKINSENQNIYIIEDIDDEHVLIQAAKHDELKARLNAALKDTVREPEESESE